jgi:putative ABC transport system permease protein
MDNFYFLEKLIRELSPYVGLSHATQIIVGGCAAGFVILVGMAFLLFPRYFNFILKSLGRNPLRTTLAGMAVAALVFVVTLIWSVLVFLDAILSEKSKDLKAIVSERWQFPSQMPYSYAGTLEEGAAEKPGDARPEDSMTWTFYGGTIDPNSRKREDFVFFFALDPAKLRTTRERPAMMDDLEDLDQKLVEKLVNDKHGCILGIDRLKALNKRVGETFTVTGFSFKDINLEFKILGTFPEGRYNQSAVMHRDYLLDALDAYKKAHNGTEHVMASKALNLVWLRVPESKTFRQVSDQIMNSHLYNTPAVKCETAASGIASFIEPYRDFIGGLKYIVVPALLIVMVLVIAVAISISVRERRMEMAVLKVLGYGPGRILGLVLGEALLVGCGFGLLSAALTYGIIHGLMGGFPFRIGFTPTMDIPADSLWWGILFGGSTSLVGSIWPAWSASRVKVAEVFAKVA